MQTVYCVVETLEREGIREFDVIQIRLKKEDAVREMKKFVEEDPYGDFAEKGFNMRSETCCESNYDDGYTMFAVVEKILN